jgi:ATP-binding cassette, subfamily A (ABC1), member 3
MIVALVVVYYPQGTKDRQTSWRKTLIGPKMALLPRAAPDGDVSAFLYQNMVVEEWVGACACKKVGIVGVPEVVTEFTTYLTNDIIPSIPTDMFKRLCTTEAPPGAPSISIVSFDSESALEDEIVDTSVCMGVVFRNDILSNTDPEVTIRVNRFFPRPLPAGEYIYPEGNWNEESDSDRHVFLQSGFLGMQAIVQEFILSKHTKFTDLSEGFSGLMDIELMPYPRPPRYTLNPLAGNIYTVMEYTRVVLLFVLGLLITKFVAKLITERNGMYKEYLKVMGLTDSAFYLSGYTFFGTFWLLESLSYSGMFCAYYFPASTTIGYLIGLMMLAWFSMAGFAYSLSSVFSQVRLGSVVSFVVFMVIPLASSGVTSTYTGARYLLLIFPQSALVQAFINLIRMQYGTASGITASNMFTQSFYGVTMIDIYAMLFVGSIFWFCVHYYLESVNPFLPGTRRSWYFVFTGHFWKHEVFGIPEPVEDVGKDETEKLNSESVSSISHKLEIVSDPQLVSQIAAKRCIQTEKLGKRFGSTNAVSDLSLTMYSGEIFCLLGHNGAGKTTTFSMLTGMLPKSAGSISILGRPEDSLTLRNQIGICPQKSVLYDELSVMEHMRLFAGLRGIEWNADCQASVDRILFDLGLRMRESFLVKSLSGGMKRKLSLGISFIGNPKVVFLDEPTSGMDPLARRSTWDLLKQRKKDCIICLTTHYMDEADALADRIGIMANGKLECCGSPIFLKKLYGCGYVLTFVKTNGGDSEPIEKFVRKKMQSTVPSAVRVITDSGKELMMEIHDSPNLTQLLVELDDPKVLAQIGVQSYGIGVTNIEEVFLKVAGLTEGDRTGKFADLVRLPPPTRFSGFNALFKRRLQLVYREPMYLMMLLLMVFVIGGILPILDSTFSSLIRSYQGGPGMVFDAKLLNKPSGDNVVRVTSNHALIWNEYCVDGGFTNSTTRCTGVQVGEWESRYDVQDMLLADADSFYKTTKSHSFFTYTETRKDINVGSDYKDRVGGRQEGILPARRDVPEGATPPRRFMTIWHNTTSPYSAPLGLLGYFNSKAAKFGVQATISHKPLVIKLPANVVDGQSLRDAALSYASVLVISAAMSFVAGAAIFVVAYENTKKIKDQLIISGISVKSYWLANFVFDSIVAIILVVGVTGAVLGGLGISGYVGDSTRLGATIILLFLTAPATVAYAHFFGAFVYRYDKSAVRMIVNLTIFFSPFIAYIYFGLRNYAGEGFVYYVIRVLTVFGRMVPPFNLAVGLGTIIMDPRSTGAIYRANMFQPDLCKFQCGVGDEIVFLSANIVLYLGLGILFDTLSWLPGVRSKFVQSARNSEGKVGDSGVVEETKRVDAISDKTTEKMAAVHLSKVFKSRPKFWHSSTYVTAVDNVTFGSDRSEIFGLLGTNGAGKSTTFRMLCGLYQPSAGAVFVNGCEITKDGLGPIRRSIGYCAQEDALWGELTVREHLEFYGKVRGYTENELSRIVSEMIDELDLTTHASKKAKHLSGGYKRKLSAGMALIGQPQVLFLDEPSCGVDPFTRRKMWDIIQSLAASRKESVIVLSTHSMEEAEALCDRVAIQVDGSFRSLGTCQEIKSRHGSDGFEVSLKCASIGMESIEQIMAKWGETGGGFTMAQCLSYCGSDNQRSRIQHKSFGVSRVAEATPGPVLAQWIYNDGIFGDAFSFLLRQFPNNGVSLLEMNGMNARVRIEGTVKIGALFKALNEHKSELRIEDFQVSQTTLEQVFNRFASTSIAKQDTSMLH